MMHTHTHTHTPHTHTHTHTHHHHHHQTTTTTTTRKRRLPLQKESTDQSHHVLQSRHLGAVTSEVLAVRRLQHNSCTWKLSTGNTLSNRLLLLLFLLLCCRCSCCYAVVVLVAMLSLFLLLCCCCSCCYAVVAGQVLNVPATCTCCSETDMLNRFSTRCNIYKLKTTLAISASHSTLTPGQPLPAFALQRQAPGRAASRVSICKLLVFFFFFFCIPSYISGVHHFGRNVCVYNSIFLIHPYW